MYICFALSLSQHPDAVSAILLLFHLIEEFFLLLIWFEFSSEVCHIERERQVYVYYHTPNFNTMNKCQNDIFSYMY